MSNSLDDNYRSSNTMTRHNRCEALQEKKFLLFLNVYILLEIFTEVSKNLINL